jgi:hypothetical protein
MWTETMRHIATDGNGNLITFDGSVRGMEQTLQQLMAMQRYQQQTVETSVESATDVAVPGMTAWPAPTGDNENNI